MNSINSGLLPPVVRAFPLVLMAMALPQCASDEKVESSGPHILFLTVDTLRPDYLGMYGYDRDSSPYLDSLLADAFHFPAAITTVPRTTPALASMLTGAYPHNHGVRGLHHVLRDDVVPITEVLKDNGYQTLAVVTNQVIGPERRLSRGFDAYLHAKDLRGARATTDVAIERLQDIDFETPLFLWMHYIDPHMPYVADPKIIQSFDPDYSGDYALNFGQISSGHIPKSPYPPELPKAVAVHQNPLSEEVVEHIRRLYASDIRSTDDQIRRLVEDLRKRTGDNLFIVFTADHGESLGEHDFYWDHGDYVYNAASRIPLAILPPPGHPARQAGSWQEWVSIIDIVPTVLELTGHEIPESMLKQMDGQSLAPAMRGKKLESRPIFVESGVSHYFQLIKGRASNDNEGRFRAVYSGDWKLIWAPGHDDPKLSWQIYNLADDPYETQNLWAPDHPQLESLQLLLLPWAEKSLGGANDSAPSAVDLKLMAELGYVDSDGY